MTPAPMNRFEAGQCAMRVPVSTSRPSSRVGEVDRVGQDRLRPEPAGPVVDVDVVAGLGEEPADLGDLDRILRHVGLPPGARSRGPARPTRAACSAVQEIANRGVTAYPSRPLSAPCQRPMRSADLAQRALEDRGRLDRRVVGRPIHHHLAEDRPDPVRLGGAERRVHGRLVDDAVGKDRRCAGGREGLEDGRGEPLGDRGIGPRPLGRKGQPIEPRQQVEREPDPGVRELRQVGVRVDHPRQQDPGPEVEGGDADVARRGRRRSDGGDPTRGVDVDERVGFVQEPAGRERGQQSRPKRERRTFRKLATRHDARLARPSRADSTVVVGLGGCPASAQRPSRRSSAPGSSQSVSGGISAQRTRDLVPNSLGETLRHGLRSIQAVSEAWTAALERGSGPIELVGGRDRGLTVPG